MRKADGTSPSHRTVDASSNAPSREASPAEIPGSTARSRLSRRGAPVVLALVSVAALGGCGLWPSFPASLLDGSPTPRDVVNDLGPEDAPVDAPTEVVTDVTELDATDAMDVPSMPEGGEAGDAMIGEGGDPDAADGDETAAPDGDVDADPDAMPMTDAPVFEGGGGPGGFRVCTDPAPAGPFTPEMVLAGEPNSRDLAFDGMGNVATGEAHVILFNAMGMRRQLTPDGMQVYAYGMRYLPDGALAIGSTRAGLSGAVRIVPATGMPVETINMDLGTGSFIAAHPDGSMYVSDSTNQSVYRFSRSGMRTTAFMLAAGTALSPTGLAISPDGTKLYVGSTVQRRIYEVTLNAAGVMTGTERTYAEGVFNGQGLAFDDCGRLYISDRDRGRILRVPTGGGTPEVIATRPATGSFTPWGLAFGRGTGFASDALFTVDSTTGAIYRIPVGAQGAHIPGAPATGSGG